MHALILAAAIALARLHGTVLSVAPDGTVFVFHDSFGGMPAMTMPFRVPRDVQLHAGDRIEAAVDETTQPWSLRDIHAVAATLPPRRSDGPRVSIGGIAPDARFVDQRDRPFRLADLRGHAYALAFIYSRCRDASMCPLVSAKFAALQRALPPGTALVEVTLDPRYDRPAVLATYGRAYGADPLRWHLLSGDPAQLAAFARIFGIISTPANPTTIVHSERLAIVSPLGRITSLYDGATWSVVDVREWLARASAVRPATRTRAAAGRRD